jgi:hypothetical protein
MPASEYPDYYFNAMEHEIRAILTNDDLAANHIAAAFARIRADAESLARTMVDTAEVPSGGNKDAIIADMKEAIEALIPEEGVDLDDEDAATTLKNLIKHIHVAKTELFTMRADLNADLIARWMSDEVEHEAYDLNPEELDPTNLMGTHGDLNAANNDKVKRGVLGTHMSDRNATHWWSADGNRPAVMYAIVTASRDAAIAAAVGECDKLRMAGRAANSEEPKQEGETDIDYIARIARASSDDPAGEVLTNLLLRIQEAEGLNVESNDLTGNATRIKRWQNECKALNLQLEAIPEKISDLEVIHNAVAALKKLASAKICGTNTNEADSLYNHTLHRYF